MAKTKHDRNHIGQLGVSWVQWIIEGIWGCGVETISAHNDNSVDILIFLKRRENSSYAGPTGDVIFAQIKCGYVSKAPAVASNYSINLGNDHISAHRPRWLSLPGPAIMINVIPPRITKGTPLAYWTDLRDPANYGKTTIKFSTSRRIDESSKGDLFNLCWRNAELRKLPVLTAPKSMYWSNSLPNQISDINVSFHAACKTFYSDLKKDSLAHCNKYIANITNRGWRHITRIGRPKTTMFQSLTLLPVASRMLEASSNLEAIRLTKPTVKFLPDGRRWERCLEGVTARITFYERQEAVVRVIIERTEIFTLGSSGAQKSHIERCFFSVYEVARRRASI